MMKLILLMMVEFHIQPGTDRNNWNTPESPVLVKAGDTLVIHNDDLITHQLHTFGTPCSHGGPIYPGEFSDYCVINAGTEPGPYVLYDHRTFARFHVSVIPQESTETQ